MNYTNFQIKLVSNVNNFKSHYFVSNKKTNLSLQKMCCCLFPYFFILLHGFHGRCSPSYLVVVGESYDPCRSWWVGEGEGETLLCCHGNLGTGLDLQTWH